MKVQFRNITAKPAVNKTSFKGLEEEMKDFNLVDNFLWVGNPTAGQIKALKLNGVTHMVSFRPDYHGNHHEEVKAVTRSGIEHLHFPFPTSESPPPLFVEIFTQKMQMARLYGQKIFLNSGHSQHKASVFASIYRLRYNLDNLQNCLTELAKLDRHSKSYPQLIIFLKRYAQALK